MKQALLVCMLFLVGCAGGSGGSDPVVSNAPDLSPTLVTTVYKLICRSGEVRVELYPGVYSGWYYELEMYSNGSYRIMCSGATAAGYNATNESTITPDQSKFPSKSCVYTSVYNAGVGKYVRSWTIEPALDLSSGNRGTIKALCTTSEALLNPYCAYNEPMAPIIRVQSEPAVYDIYGTCYLTLQ
jgi:hypothetical protein